MFKHVSPPAVKRTAFLFATYLKKIESTGVFSPTLFLPVTARFEKLQSTNSAFRLTSADLVAQTGRKLAPPEALLYALPGLGTITRAIVTLRGGREGGKEGGRLR